MNQGAPTAGAGPQSYNTVGQLTWEVWLKSHQVGMAVKHSSNQHKNLYLDVSNAFLSKTMLDFPASEKIPRPAHPETL